jgi:site-specific recombinase XerD
MKANSQRVRRNIIDRFCRELGGDGKPRGDRSAAGLQKAHVVKYVADRSAKPDSANGLRKVLRALMQHAISLKLRADDPTRDVKALRSKNRSGFHRWTDGEIAQFEARHAIGTKPRLAMALGLYFGQARQDIVAMGRQHVRDEVLYGRG